jgi:POT family proton-dependent oligopeptide transporter
MGGIGGHPKGLTLLFFAEMWERFSFYGMRAILMVFMVTSADLGGLGLDQSQAAWIYGNYTMACYLLCILGGFLADNFIGARRAVLAGGLVITAGHYTLAVDSLPCFHAGLALVAVGTGLLKPNISTLVGSLYRPDDRRRDAGFSLFYMGINLGAFLSPLVTGWLAQSAAFRGLLEGWGLDPNGCWHWGFGAAALGMTAGMVVYVRGLPTLGRAGEAPDRDEPRPWGQLGIIAAGTALLLILIGNAERWAWAPWAVALVAVAKLGHLTSLLRPDERPRMGAILVFFASAVAFWALFEQAGSTLALFAEQLTLNEVGGAAFPSSWFQSVNALFVLMLAPVFAWAWVRLGDREPSVPAKFALGLLFLGLSFALMVPASAATAAGKVSPLWLLGVYFLQTVGEMCLSPVGLSTMTKLAPRRLGGMVMGVWFLAGAIGNKLAGSLSAGYTGGDPSALADFFLNQAMVVLGLTAGLFAISPWVRRMMGVGR